MSAVVDFISYLYHIPHNFSANSGRVLLDAYPDYPVYPTVLYLVMIFYLPGYLKKRNKVFKIKAIVAAWNLFLSLISFVGAYYVDALAYDFVFHDRGFYKTCCEILQFPDGSQFGVNIRDMSRKGATAAAARQTMLSTKTAIASAAGNSGFAGGVNGTQKNHSDKVNSDFYGVASFYMAVFMYLKTPELLDTLFLVLQGKPVSFLHWFHHIVTATYCWYAGYALTPSGVFFIAMNYSVHSVMYFYYFLVVLGFRKKIRWFAPVITLMQCSQMFAGMFITCYTYLQYWLGPEHKGELFYEIFRIGLSAFHYAAVQSKHLISHGTILPSEKVSAYKMSEHFTGCQTSTTGLRMSVMMYGAYCVLFWTLLVELYFTKEHKKNSLVLARHSNGAAEENTPSTAVDNGDTIRKQSKTPSQHHISGDHKHKNYPGRKRNHAT